MSVKLTLFEFWKLKEAELNTTISIREMAREIGVSRSTLSGYMNNKVDRPDMRIVGKICKYFNVPPGPVPFIVYED